ncbi:MAG: HEPN domain-containing protein [Chloroflexi bacterium]|nr:HEPN domain-containing protein [Chloroflexota bacterium]
MTNRARDWLTQAERDLKLASDSQRSGYHEWACFAAHQVAEKAVKALHLRLGQEVWGHVIVDLLTALPGTTSIPSNLKEEASYLDNLYIPSRYPNGHAAGAPFEHYTRLQSDQAITYASEILEFVRSQMA